MDLFAAPSEWMLSGDRISCSDVLWKALAVKGLFFSVVWCMYVCMLVFADLLICLEYSVHILLSVDNGVVCYICT